MKALFVLIIPLAWILSAIWLGTLTSNQPPSGPPLTQDEPPAEYEGRMEPQEPDCQVKLHLLKKAKDQSPKD